jgi:hypothetical protein
MLQGKRLFELPDAKPVSAKFYVTINIASWLGIENIRRYWSNGHQYGCRYGEKHL